MRYNVIYVFNLKSLETDANRTIYAPLEHPNSKIIFAIVFKFKLLRSNFTYSFQLKLRLVVGNILSL